MNADGTDGEPTVDYAEGRRYCTAVAEALTDVGIPPTERWDESGGTALYWTEDDLALLVRYPARARLSKDIDLQRLEGDPEEALAALLKAATTDLGDHLHFVPRQLKPHGNDAEGVNQPFDVLIGTRKVDTIHVDLGRVSSRDQSAGLALAAGSGPVDVLA
ncbi:hypothetical protein [Streptomyces sp. NPDC057582]|uniref:hypothetical protein n=1 Tax=Streptomyces sp. NPDC057582 TaxID=3346174 RepID=UPI00368FE9EA